MEGAEFSEMSDACATISGSSFLFRVEKTELYESAIDVDDALIFSGPAT
jgi:hypothetical protein